MQNPLRDSILLLVLIMLTLVAYFFMSRMRVKRATYFGNLETLERTHGFRIFHVSSTILIAKIIMIILLYMVATNSFEIREFQTKTDTDYVLLIDVSSSMSNIDFEPNRLSSAKDISKQWLTVLPNSTSVGMVAFSQGIESFEPMTFKHSLIRDAINNLEIDYSKSGTNLDYAISYAADLLNQSIYQKTILLVTDGTEYVNNLTIAKLNDQNIKVYSFGIGSDEIAIDLEEIPEDFREDYVSLGLNFTLLEELSNSTGGVAYKITDSIELEENFKSATYEQVKVSVNSSYYIAVLIAILSILELILYAKLGAL